MCKASVSNANNKREKNKREKTKMIGNKTLVLVVAVLAVGLFVLPSALSLFAGQHTFGAKGDVKCSKCHGPEYGEIEAGSAHKTSEFGTGDARCKQCHQLEGVFDTTKQHASVSLPCIACHESGIYGVETELLNESESHRDFYLAALNSSVETGGNEVCIACHTMVGVNITWVRATTLTFEANHDPTGAWIISDFTATGSVTNTTTSP